MTRPTTAQLNAAYDQFNFWYDKAKKLDEELAKAEKRIAELSRLLAHNIERAEKAEKRLVYSKDAIATWERKAISNFDECAIMSQRIIELEAIKSDASQVFKEIGNELGCNPDNESIMMAIDDLKATQMTGPLKEVLKRNIELEAKTAMTMGVGSGNGNLFVHGDYDSIKAAQAIVLENESLRAKLATPVRLPTKYSLKLAGDKSTRAMFSGHNSAINDSADAIRAAGFKVEGDEQ